MRKSSTFRAFHRAAKRYAFKGNGEVKLNRYANYWLMVHYSRPAYSRRAKIRVALFFHEFLTVPLETAIIEKAVRKAAPLPAQVEFMLEQCPGVPDGIMELMERCEKMGDTKGLEMAMADGLMRLKKFLRRYNSWDKLLSHERMSPYLRPPRRGRAS